MQKNNTKSTGSFFSKEKSGNFKENKVEKRFQKYNQTKKNIFENKQSFQ